MNIHECYALTASEVILLGISCPIHACKKAQHAQIHHPGRGVQGAYRADHVDVRGVTVISSQIS